MRAEGSSRSIATSVGTGMEPPLLRGSPRDGVASLTLNRPASYNALSEALLSALQEGLDRVAADPDVRVVVLAARGRAFCAGHDLREMHGRRDREHYRALFQRCGRVMQTMRELPQPVIARVHGLATAAGCQLVAACDLAVASEEARFATSGINVGLFCSTPAVPVSRNVPPKGAFELLFTGDFVSAERAQALGLVNQVVPADELDEAVRALAEKIAAKSPHAVRTGKEMFYRQLGLPLAQAYDYAAEVMADGMMSEDASEGIEAFLGKRAPVWRGR